MRERQRQGQRQREDLPSRIGELLLEKCIFSCDDKEEEQTAELWWGPSALLRDAVRGVGGKQTRVYNSE